MRAPVEPITVSTASARMRCGGRPLCAPAATSDSPPLRAASRWQTVGGPVPAGAATRNTDGTTYGASFTDLTGTTDSKRLVQPGIEAKNDSGTSLEMGLLTSKLDRRGV
jgi:hypothetical protein